MATSLIKTSQNSIKYQANRITGKKHRTLENDRIIKGFFLSYQNQWITDESSLVIAEKGRRTGFTYAESYRAFRLAAMGVKSCFYTSYNYHASKNFIRKVGNWARAFNIGYEYMTGRSLLNADSIGVFKVQLSNGFFVEALPGNPENLRDKEGDILVDEGAHRRDLHAVLAAAMATQVWGFSVRIWSTHNGKGEFYQLVEDVKNGRRKGSFHSIPFKRAISSGLYRKICDVNNVPYSKENEDAFVKDLYDNYADSGNEELDAIPSANNGRVLVSESDWKSIDCRDISIRSSLMYRYWDLAATDGKENPEACYTATISFVITDEHIIIYEAKAEQLSATDGDDWIKQTARNDPPNMITLIEQEPGSASIKYGEYLKNELSDCYIELYKPIANKLVRAIPLAPAIKSGKIRVNRNMDNYEHFITTVSKFDGSHQKLVNDWMDCISGTYDHLHETNPDWIAS